MNLHDAMRLAEGFAFDEPMMESVDDNYVITIGAGTELYHGSEKEIQSPDNVPTWFGEDPAISETYGDIVSTYELKGDIRCVNFRENRSGMKTTSQGYAITGTDDGFKRLILEIHKLAGIGIGEFKKYLKYFSQYGTIKHGQIAHLEHPKVIEYLKSEGFDGIALDDEPSYGSRGSWYASVFLFEPAKHLTFKESYEV